MGFDTGRVVLDRNDLTYTAGQVVSGKLEFKQDKVKTFRGIHVTAKGFCTTHWTTRHTRTVHSREETYHVSHDAHETYFESRMYLIGGASGECQLKPGQYSFPFQTILPANCPSSYEGTYGHIRYELKFVVDRAFKIDQEKKIRMNVVAVNDLNMNPYARQPMLFEFEEALHACCCCFSMGKYEVTAKVPQSGFCPKQTIPIELRCLNNSRGNIKHIKFELEENRIYRTTDDTKYASKTIAKLKKGPVPSDTSRQWEVEMIIPDMEVHNVAACRWIDIDYIFKVTVVPEGCHSNSDASKGVVLGHVPLRDLNDPNQMPAQQPGIENTNMYPPPYSVPVPGYPDGDTGFPGLAPYPIEHDKSQQANSPYPGGNGNPPYPGGTGNSPYPRGNSPYLEKSPQATAPYPGGNSPYPGENPPYPGGNPPYPNEKSPQATAPYPGGNTAYPASPYPTANSPNPNVSPYPNPNPPYPGLNPPTVTPYPTVPPYPTSVSHPMPDNPPVSFPMPTITNQSQGSSPYPPPANPFATASAPEPATPDNLDKNPMP